jgi:hypothetical protein
MFYLFLYTTKIQVFLKIIGLLLKIICIIALLSGITLTKGKSFPATTPKI